MTDQVKIFKTLLRLPLIIMTSLIKKFITT